MHTSSEEQESLKLLSDIVAEVTHALGSLGGKEHSGLFDTYRFYSSKHVHRAADGFVFLRTSGRVDASKLLVRPVIEIMFRLQAVRKHPELLYRIAYSEHLQDERFLRSAAKSSSMPYSESQIKKRWQEFTAKFKKEFPTLKTVEKELKIVQIAEKAGLTAVYDSHYRIYCQYTHGALRASAGYLDDATDPHDNRTMALCAFAALDTLVSLVADSPNYDSLFQRLAQQGTEATSVSVAKSLS